VVCIGGRSGLVGDCTSGEFRDASDLGLTGSQQELVERVVATGTPTVVVLINGRVLALPWILDNVAAVVEAWVPGEEGGHAIADVLFGAVGPSGRLPITMPRSVGQLPVYYNRKWGKGGTLFFTADYSDLTAEPLLPFGHGLSYTSFEYSDLAIAAPSIGADGEVGISCRIANAGERDGVEVAQLYVRDPVASTTRPERQLAGFARIALAAGEAKTVEFTLDASQLALYDRGMRFVVETGQVDVMIGASSQDIRLEGSFEIMGEERVLKPADLKATAVRIE
jgi:beta-glucosidase